MATNEISVCVFFYLLAGIITAGTPCPACQWLWLTNERKDELQKKKTPGLQRQFGKSEAVCTLLNIKAPEQLTTEESQRPLQFSKILTCSRHCRVPKPSRFSYQDDQVYDYSYTVETATYLSHSPEQSSRLHIEATVQIHVISTCDMVLKLREIHIKELSDPTSGLFHKVDNSKYFRHELEKKSLPFSFFDGRINDLCPAEDEDAWILNFKRGFLSVFQNSMVDWEKGETILEMDVMGECQTVYSVTASGLYGHIVTKSRNLHNCSRNHEHPSSHHEPKFLQFPLTGNQSCEQTIGWPGLITSGRCTEQHHFRPVPEEATEAVTIVSQTIQFLQQREGGNYSPLVNKRTSLEYEPPLPTYKNSERITAHALPTVRQALRHFCSLAEILPETTEVFYDLVSGMRQLPWSNLRKLYDNFILSEDPYCNGDVLRVKQIFLDSLAMAGTNSAIRLLFDVLKGPTQQTAHSLLVLTTLPFLHVTSAAMLGAAATFLEQEPTSQIAMLAISAMVNSFCENNSDCPKNDDVIRIMQRFKRVIGAECYVDDENREEVLLGLTAIGNAGHVMRVVEVVNNCLKRRNNPLDVRLAALHAFRRFPCLPVRESLSSVFEDTEEDTEIRVLSYLTIMQCVTTSDFPRLQSVLVVETNPQVKSFVLTHLENLQSTSKEMEEEVRNLLIKVNTASKEFSGLRTSRNVAGTFLSDTLGINANVIWPQSSSSRLSSTLSTWIPLSTTVKLTLKQLLGKEVEVAEVGVRGEGLQVLLEDVLSPILGERKAFVGPKKRLEKMQRVRSSLFARIFGNDLAIPHLPAFHRFRTSLTAGKFFGREEILSSMLAEGSTTLSQNLILWDHNLMIPTSCGLPLTVSAKGILMAHLQLSGKLDLRQALDQPRAVFTRGSVTPSFALRATTTMTMDAVVTKAALRMTGTVHSNSILKGHVQMDSGKFIDMELDIPRKEMTLIDARTEISFLLHGQQYPLTLPQDIYYTHRGCAGQRIVQLVGLDLCTELSLPKSTTSVLHALLTKPFLFRATLHKMDTHSQYKFLIKHVKEAGSVNTQLLFSTPGSQVDRTFDLGLNVNKKHRKLEVRMISPWKKAVLSGELINTPILKRADCFLELDNAKQGIWAEVQIIRSKEDLTYVPVFELRLPGNRSVLFTGSATVGRFWKKLSFAFNLSGLFNGSQSLKGAMLNSRKEVSLRVTVSLDSRRSYSLSMGTFLTVTEKASANIAVSPFLLLSSAHTELLALTGKGNFRKDRTLRADLQLLTKWTNPASVQCMYVVTPSPRGRRYRLYFHIKSSLARISLDARLGFKGRQQLQTRISFVYDIPSLPPQDTLTKTSKLATMANKNNLWSSTVKSRLASKVPSKYNFQFTLTVDHDARKSRFKLHHSFGSAHVVQRTSGMFSLKVTHIIVDVRHLVLAVHATAHIPSENISLEVTVRHRHSSREVESKLLTNYGNQQVRAHLILEDRSTHNLKLTGKFALDLPNSTGLERRIISYGRFPKKIPDLLLSIKFLETEEKFQISSGAHAGRQKRDFLISLHIMKPLSIRYVQIYCKGSPYSQTYQEFEAEFSHTMHPLLADVIEISLGMEQVDLDVKKSLSLLASNYGTQLLKNNTENTVGFEYSQDYVDRLFSRSQNQTAFGSNDLGMNIVNIQSGLEVSSSILRLVSASLRFDHQYDSKMHRTEISLANSGQNNYLAEIAVEDGFSDWLYRSGGTLVVVTPDRTLTSDWHHRILGSSVTSNFSASWAEGQRVYFDVSGRLAESCHREIFGDIVLQSPWQPVSDWRVKVAPVITGSKLPPVHMSAINETMAETGHPIHISKHEWCEQYRATDLTADLKLYPDDDSGVRVELHQNQSNLSSNTVANLSLPVGQSILISGRMEFHQGVRGSFLLRTPYPGLEDCRGSLNYSLQGLEHQAEGNITLDGLTILSRLQVAFSNHSGLLQQPYSVPLAKEKFIRMLGTLKHVNASFRTVHRLGESNSTEKKSTDNGLSAFILYNRDSALARAEAWIILRENVNDGIYIELYLGQIPAGINNISLVVDCGENFTWSSNIILAIANSTDFSQKDQQKLEEHDENKFDLVSNLSIQSLNGVFSGVKMHFKTRAPSSKYNLFNNTGGKYEFLSDWVLPSWLENVTTDNTTDIFLRQTKVHISGRTNSGGSSSRILLNLNYTAELNSGETPELFNHSSGSSGALNLTTLSGNVTEIRIDHIVHLFAECEYIIKQAPVIMNTSTNDDNNTIAVRDSYGDISNNFSVRDMFSEISSVPSAVEVTVNMSPHWSYLLSKEDEHLVQGTPIHTEFFRQNPSGWNLSVHLGKSIETPSDSPAFVEERTFSRSSFPWSFYVLLLVHWPFGNYLYDKAGTRSEQEAHTVSQGSVGFAQLRKDDEGVDENQTVTTPSRSSLSRISVAAVYKHVRSSDLLQADPILSAHPPQQLQTVTFELTKSNIPIGNNSFDDLKKKKINVFSLGLVLHSPSFREHNQSDVRSSAKGEYNEGSLRLDLKLPDIDSRLYLLNQTRSGGRVRKLGFRVTLSGKTLAVEHLFQRTAKGASSHSELRWGQLNQSEKMLSYDYNLRKKTRPSEHEFHGYFKIQTINCSNEGNISWIVTVHGTNIQQQTSSKPHTAMIFWDLERDQMNQVKGFLTLTSGQNHTLAASLTLPAISQSFRLKGILSTQANNTIWNSSAIFSYSSDTGKSLNFIATLADTSIQGDSFNYSLVTSLTQLSSFLELGFVSSIKGNSTEYASSFRGWFMNSRQQMQEASWISVFQRQTKKLKSTIKTPYKEMSLEAHIPSSEIYQPILLGKSHDLQTSDNSSQIALTSHLDIIYRSFFINIQLGADDPAKSLSVKVWTVNDSIIQAAANRSDGTTNITDSIFTTCLKPSSLLHLHLSWRPEILVDIGNLTPAVLHLLEHARNDWQDLVQLVIDEISIKSKTVMKTIADKAMPAYHFLANESKLLEENLECILEDSDGLHQTAKELLEHLGERFKDRQQKIRQQLHLLITSFQSYSLKTADWLRAFLNSSENSTFVQHRDHILTNVSQQITIAKSYSVQKFEDIVASFEQLLMTAYRHMTEISNITSPTSRSDTNDQHPDGSLMNAFFKNGSGKNNSAENFMESLKDILEAEMRFRLRHFRFWQQNLITVKRPNEGALEAEMCLPFPVTFFLSEMDMGRLWTDLLCGFAKQQFHTDREKLASESDCGT